jgi:hypothetical protein
VREGVVVVREGLVRLVVVVVVVRAAGGELVRVEELGQ